MKPIRVSALARTAAAIAAISTFTSGAGMAASIYWDGTVNPGTWSAAANWSTTTAAAGANPAAAPTAADTAIFTVAAITTAQTVTVDGPQAVLGLGTASQTATTTLTGTASTSSLKIGTGGINHTNGGLAIGSATAGSEVPISLQGGQTWTSSAAGGGAAAILVQNAVNIGAGGSQTLTLTGSNTGSIINGNISDGAGVLSIVKNAVGTTAANRATTVWTLNGTANTFSGTLTINEGILRVTNAGAFTPANTTVASGATISMRVAGTGFTSAQVDNVINAIHLAASGSNLSLDTANGSFTYGSNIAGNLNFVKVGANALTLSGTNTYTGLTNVNEGTLILGGTALPPIGADPAPIKVASGATLGGLVGPGGFTDTALFALPSKAVFTGTIQPFAISTANGDGILSSVITGSTRYQKVSANTLTLSGASTTTGGFTLNGGTLRVTSINNGGVAGALGAGTADAANITISTGRLMYGGAAGSTDRLFNFGASFSLDASGTGAINFTNTGIYATSGTASARTITLTGYSKDANTLKGVIQNSGASTLTSVTKRGSGSWVLSGANTYTGTTRVDSGSLTFDYATADPIPSTAGTVLLTGGTMVFKAGAAATSDTLPVLSFTTATNSNYQQYGSKLKLEGGFTLNVTRLDSGGLTQRQDLIDLSTPGTNVINVAALNANNNIATVNGILMSNAASTANARANIVVKKGSVYGFSRLSGGTSGVLENIPVASLTNVPASGSVTLNNLSANYYMKDAGSYDLSQDASFQTITVNTTAGEINLNQNGYILLPTPNPTTTPLPGRALLFYGPNNAYLSNYLDYALGPQSYWIHNYLDDNRALEISASFNSGNFVIIGGTGLTIYTGNRGYGSPLLVNGGIFRGAYPYGYSYNSEEIRVTNGGVYEVGEDLNSDTPGDFSKTVTTAAGGMGFYGDSGMSAYTASAGGRRVVNFMTQTYVNEEPVLTSQSLTWGTNRFLTLPAPEDNVDGDFAFKLSSPRSNATVEIQNAINLNGRQRTVEVANGSAALDAELSGVLSGSTGSACGIVKTGAGTLALSGQNTYTGETVVKEGTLRVIAGALNAASTVRVESTGVLNVTGAVHVSGATINGVVQAPGVVPASAFVTGSGTLTVDAQNTPYNQWVIDQALAAGQSAPTFDADSDGLVNLIEYLVGTNPKTPNGSVLSQVPGTPSAIRFARASGRTDITVVVEGSVALATGAWQTIATSTAGGAFTAQAGVAATISESGGIVTVTDAPGSTRRYYRVRVEK